MQSFVFIIMPFLMMGGLAIGAIAWGGGRFLDGAKTRVRLSRTERRLEDTNALLKEVAGQSVLDVSVQLGLGQNLLDRIGEQSEVNDTALGRGKQRRALH